MPSPHRPAPSAAGLFGAFADVWMVDGLRTPMVDYCGALGGVSATDLGIKVARDVLARANVPATDVSTVIAGNMAPSDCYQFVLPRHIGLYAGVPEAVPAHMVQRICGTGFEVFRQAGDHIERGYGDVALVVGSESMTRNPIAAFEHRTGFKLGAPVGFKDYLWEALVDPAPGIDMIQTAENLAVKYGVTREEVDRFAARSFERAVAAQAAGWFDGEITPVTSESFVLDGHATRSLQLPRKVERLSADTHPRPSPVEVLAKLKAVHKHGVQTGGNSSALVDAAAAAVVASGRYVRERSLKPLGRLAAAAVVGVPPEIMGIGPAPAIRRLLDGAGLTLADIGRFEINEAQGAQTLAVAKALGLDLDRLNVHGGAIALGHPLAATGVRLTITVARQLREAGLRWGVASACIGGGQGIALLIENPDAA